MEHNKSNLIWLLTAAVGFLFLLSGKTMIQGISGLAELFQPFLMGVAIAFILSQPYEWFERFYTTKMHIKYKTAHILAILSAYLMIFAVLAAVIGVVIPQLIGSIRLFAQNAEYYVKTAHQMAMQRICTAAKNKDVFLAYRVAMPRRRFKCRKVFSTRCCVRYQ